MHAGRAAGDGNRMMPEQLKPPQREQRHEVANVQTVGGGVEAAIKRDGRGNFFGQLRRIGAIGNKAAPFQFFQNAHAGQVKLPMADCQFPIERWGETSARAVVSLAFKRSRRRSTKCNLTLRLCGFA